MYVYAAQKSVLKSSKKEGWLWVIWPCETMTYSWCLFFKITEKQNGCFMNYPVQDLLWRNNPAFAQDQFTQEDVMKKESNQQILPCTCLCTPRRWTCCRQPHEIFTKKSCHWGMKKFKKKIFKIHSSNHFMWWTRWLQSLMSKVG